MLPNKSPTMSTVTLPDRQYILLHDVSWDDYRSFERMVDDQPGHRLTYDRGRLEFMTLSHLHESVKMLIHDLLVVLCDEFDSPRKNGGQTTFRREDLGKGLEPDQCYYLENEPLVRGKDELDLTADPPPDLVIEIEITRSAIDRLGIFAALGIPEIWCTDGEQVRNNPRAATFPASAVRTSRRSCRSANKPTNARWSNPSANGCVMRENMASRERK